MATIKIKRKLTTGGVGPNTEGEISTNIADKKLFIGTGSGVVTFIDTLAVDQKITTALTSAFSYKGTQSGNGQESTVNAASATELPADPKNGDYYKIDTAGYVKEEGAADTDAFFVNVNDSVVFNGTDWDKIDNTNSAVSSADSGADISVTGSTDAGFQVGFSSTAALDQAGQTVDGGTYS
jgi:hypothetical protein